MLKRKIERRLEKFYSDNGTGDGEEVDLRFVPMACQRCHVMVFPQLDGTPCP